MDNSLLPCRYKKKFERQFQPDYDMIVDRSDFKRGQDAERNARLAGNSGSTTQGVYDFPDGKIDPKKMPTQAQLALRGGRLDKADVDTLARLQKQAAREERKENLTKDRENKEKVIENARQSFIDSSTGFDPNFAFQSK